LDRRLGGPQSQSGHGVEEKNSQPLPGFEPFKLDYRTTFIFLTTWGVTFYET